MSQYLQVRGNVEKEGGRCCADAPVGCVWGDGEADWISRIEVRVWGVL